VLDRSVLYSLNPASEAALARYVSSMFHFETDLLRRCLLASPLPSPLRGEGDDSLSVPVREKSDSWCYDASSFLFPGRHGRAE
jgi:hypothetical protein